MAANYKAAPNQENHQRYFDQRTPHENEMETSELQRSVWTVTQMKNTFKKWTYCNIGHLHEVPRKCNGRNTPERCFSETYAEGNSLNKRRNHLPFTFHVSVWALAEKSNG